MSGLGYTNRVEDVENKAKKPRKQNKTKRKVGLYKLLVDGPWFEAQSTTLIF